MPLDTVLQALDRNGAKRKRHGAGWLATCPAHADSTPSLSIKEKADGRVLLHCFAGCTVHRILGELGLETRDIQPPRFEI